MFKSPFPLPLGETFSIMIRPAGDLTSEYKRVYTYRIVKVVNHSIHMILPGFYFVILKVHCPFPSITPRATGYCLPLVFWPESPATDLDSKLTTPQFAVLPPVNIFLSLGFWSV